MANFEKAASMIFAKHGQGAPHVNYDLNNKPVICSNCFKDEGLKLNAISIGTDSKTKCLNCGSNKGKKLSQELVQLLCYNFFVKGTIVKTEYGGSPIIQFNEERFNQSDIEVSSWLKEDVKLIEQAGKIGLFYYGPRMCMIGEVNPLIDLQNSRRRGKIISKIIKLYPTRKLISSDCFYRLRVNPETPLEHTEFDSAPNVFLGKGRFDDKRFPVMYGSPDLELCVHECRVTAEDNVFVAKLAPRRALKILDLSEIVDDGAPTEFESLDLAIHFLFLAGKHSYAICRQIAKRAKKAGYDGIIYPSYFSHLKTGTVPFETIRGIPLRRIPDLRHYMQSQSIPNLVLFGRPIKEKKVKVKGINKVVINQVSYDLSFGPVI